MITIFVEGILQSKNFSNEYRSDIKFFNKMSHDSTLKELRLKFKLSKQQFTFRMPSF